MAKVPTSVRLEPEEIEAIRRAAADDKRPMGMLLRLIIAEWLAEHGYLAEASPPSTPAAPRARGGGRRK
jgi:hypothetical protein